MNKIMKVIKERGILEIIILGVWYGWVRLKSLLLVSCYNVRSYDISSSVIFYGHHTLRRILKHSISIGKNCGIGENVIIRCFGKGKIVIGDNVSINENTIIYAGDGVTVGKNVIFGTNCYINDTNHEFKKTKVPMIKQGWTAKKIVIEEDVWLGANVTILDGVKLGKGCIIGAGAVVTKDVEPYAIAVGIPAKKIASRKV